MNQIAFLTLENPTGFVIYDSLCIPIFKEYNIYVTEIPWTSQINWSNFDLVIIRSTWDYQKKWKNFIQTLKYIQKETLLANNFEAVIWNYQKTYLQELKNQSFEIVDTIFLNNFLNQSEFETIQKNWDSIKLVIKPQISANADDTFILKNFEDYLMVLHHFHDKPYMIQPYIQNIEIDGEISLFYFNGEYSHAVIKKPKQGDFRVQEEHGGSILSYEPNQELLKIANSISEYLNHKFNKLLYSRLDFINHHNRWKIMELELIEPSLYFPFHKKACTNFVNSTIKWYQNFK